MTEQGGVWRVYKNREGEFFLIAREGTPVALPAEVASVLEADHEAARVLREKAELADEMERELRRPVNTDRIIGWKPFTDWLARYDALATPETEA
jgi:hypothetical protein